jgi:hypothetical protein
MSAIDRRATQLGSQDPIPDDDHSSLIGEIPPAQSVEAPSQQAEEGNPETQFSDQARSSDGCPQGQIPNFDGEQCMPAPGPEVEDSN